MSLLIILMVPGHLAGKWLGQDLNLCSLRHPTAPFLLLHVTCPGVSAAAFRPQLILLSEGRIPEAPRPLPACNLGRAKQAR